MKQEKYVIIFCENKTIMSIYGAYFCSLHKIKIQKIRSELNIAKNNKNFEYELLLRIRDMRARKYYDTAHVNALIYVGCKVYN